MSGVIRPLAGMTILFSALALSVTMAFALGADAQERAVQVKAPETRQTVPHAKFTRAVDGWREARREVRALRHQLREADRLVGLVNHPTPEGNRELARRYFGDEYACAATIIEGETGHTWRHDVAYGFRFGEHLIYSGLAYGLGQARPGTKMLRVGADAAANPLTQLIWFRSYAVARYGSVCGASAHWTPRRSW